MLTLRGKQRRASRADLDADAGIHLDLDGANLRQIRRSRGELDRNRTASYRYREGFINRGESCPCRGHDIKIREDLRPVDRGIEEPSSCRSPIGFGELEDHRVFSGRNGELISGITVALVLVKGGIERVGDCLCGGRNLPPCKACVRTPIVSRGVNVRAATGMDKDGSKRTCWRQKIDSGSCRLGAVRLAGCDHRNSLSCRYGSWGGI